MKTTENLKKAYDEWHRHRAEGEDSGITLSAPWNAFVRNAIGDVRGKKILEIAAGRGQLSAFLAGQGAEIFAADFSFEALKVLKTNYKKENLRILNADATRIGLRSDVFDALISCETIEHVLNPQKALEEYYRVLKKGGKLYLTFPNYLNSYGLYRIYLKMTGKPYNSGTAIQPIENWIFSFRIISILKKIGFKITYKGGSGFYWLQPGKPPKNLYSHDPGLPWNRMLRSFALHAYVVAEK